MLQVDTGCRSHQPTLEPVVCSAAEGQKGRESVKGCKRINQQKRGITRQCWLITDRVDVVETPVERVPVAVGRSSSPAIAPCRPSWGSASYSGTSVCACRQARPPAVAVLARANGSRASGYARRFLRSSWCSELSSLRSRWSLRSATGHTPLDGRVAAGVAPSSVTRSRQGTRGASGSPQCRGSGRREEDE